MSTNGIHEISSKDPDVGKGSSVDTSSYGRKDLCNRTVLVKTGGW